jgi:hypothetical protein
MTTLILVIALTSLACLLLLWCCCRVAAWADRRIYADPVSPPGNAPDAGNHPPAFTVPWHDEWDDGYGVPAAPSGATAPDAPPCPRCQTTRPFGPGSIEFEDEGSEMYYQCRRCGTLYFGRDVAPGRCWGIGT